MNTYWNRVIENLFASTDKELSGADREAVVSRQCMGEVIVDTMLGTAVGYYAKSRRLRAAASDLESLARDFRKQADEIDAAILSENLTSMREHVLFEPSIGETLIDGLPSRPARCWSAKHNPESPMLLLRHLCQRSEGCQI